ncbi:MAG TPA: hypothetical protein VM689_16640 [Aliidongia sp.]|nr:hypothetical protein [Aliidongia sp.]
MIELVLVYCLVADADRCIEQRPVFEEPLSGMACMMTAQRVALQYVAEHPDYKLSGWRCELDKPRQDRA